MSANEATATSNRMAGAQPKPGGDHARVSEAGQRLLDALEQMRRGSDLTDEAAMALAIEELAAARDERRDERRAVG